MIDPVEEKEIVEEDESLDERLPKLDRHAAKQELKRLQDAINNDD